MYNKVEDCIADVSTSLDYLKLRITESKTKIIISIIISLRNMENKYVQQQRI